jgi:hypothetical protein
MGFVQLPHWLANVTISHLQLFLSSVSILGVELRHHSYLKLLSLSLLTTKDIVGVMIIRLGLIEHQILNLLIRGDKELGILCVQDPIEILPVSVVIEQ